MTSKGQAKALLSDLADLLDKLLVLSGRGEHKMNCSCDGICRGFNDLANAQARLSELPYLMEALNGNARS